MPQIKTKKSDDSVMGFLNSVQDEKKRSDAFRILEMIREVTGMEPGMWGATIVGFGSYHYKYESGHEGDMCIVGFSPRKQNIALYLRLTLHDSQVLLKDLGKHKTGKGCLYISRLEDVNEDVLKKLVRSSFNVAAKKSSG